MKCIRYQYVRGLGNQREGEKDYYSNYSGRKLIACMIGHKEKKREGKESCYNYIPPAAAAAATAASSSNTIAAAVFPISLFNLHWSFPSSIHQNFSRLTIARYASRDTGSMISNVLVQRAQALSLCPYFVPVTLLLNLIEYIQK